MIRWLVAGIIFGSLVFLASPVQANHYVYLASEANAAGFSQYTWVNNRWAMGAQSHNWCSGFTSTPQGILNALAEWENAVQSSFGPEFVAGCGPSQTFLFLPASAGSIPCPGYVGCLDVSNWGYDSGRQAYYIVTANIWFNTTQYSFTDAGYRYTTGHELGHAYGLHERYLHPPPSIRCNPDENSIMDTATFSGTTVTGGCDGYNLYPDDKTRATLLYDLSPAQNVATYKTGTNSMSQFWDDVNWAESGYQLYFYYWSPSAYSWVQFFSGLHYAGVGPGDPDLPVRLSSGYSKPLYMPSTDYIICGYTHSTARGYLHWVCGQSKFLGGEV